MPPSLQTIPTGSIDTARNPRTVFDPVRLAELTESIKHVGVQQPITVVQNGPRFDLLLGERRFRASLAAGLPAVPAIVLDESPEEHQKLLVQLTENLQREPLDCLDAARGIQNLMAASGCTAAQAAHKLGYSGPSASRWLTLLHLPESILEKVRSRTLRSSLAYELAGVADPDEQLRLAEAAASGKLSRDALRREVKRSTRRTTRATTTTAPRRERRITIPLSSGSTIAIAAAAALTFDVVIDALASALALATAAHGVGRPLDEFVRDLKQHRHPDRSQPC